MLCKYHHIGNYYILFFRKLLYGDYMNGHRAHGFSSVHFLDSDEILGELPHQEAMSLNMFKILHVSPLSCGYVKE